MSSIYSCFCVKTCSGYLSRQHQRGMEWKAFCRHHPKWADTVHWCAIDFLHYTSKISTVLSTAFGSATFAIAIWLYKL